MLFKLEHKEMILAKKKTATRRVWKRPMVKVGRIYKAKLKMLSKDYFAKIKITKLFKQPLSEMTQQDCEKEGYFEMGEFRNIWIRINKEWNPNLLVDVIEFEVVE